MNDLYSDFFEVTHCTDMADRYIIGLRMRDVVSFKTRGHKYYKMSIDKVLNEDGNYGIWLWDIEANVSYPMSVPLGNISSLSEFTSFLNHTLTLANEGSFSGDKGNRIDNK